MAIYFAKVTNFYVTLKRIVFGNQCVEENVLYTYQIIYCSGKHFNNLMLNMSCMLLSSGRPGAKSLHHL